MKCCANICFIRQCLIKKVTQKYANIKIPHTSPAVNITQKKTQIIRLKDDIKFLYVKIKNTGSHTVSTEHAMSVY